MKMTAIEVEGTKLKGRIYRDGDRVIIEVAHRSEIFGKPQVFDFSAPAGDSDRLREICRNATLLLNDGAALASEIESLRALVDNFADAS